jgi:hypothetical protein
MRRLFLLVFLAGCAVAPIDSESEEEILFEDEAEMADHAYSSGGRVDPCAPIYKVTEIDGKEFVIEIPVECHPLDLPFMWWGPDDYHEISNPMDEVALPEPQQTY